jgi:2-keto-3-deoxy-L-rhamnonate aldolase RhmA
MRPEFCIYDMEHGRCDISSAQMIASCNGTQVAPMVSVSDLTAAPSSRLLDLGARGIMVPARGIGRASARHRRSVEVRTGRTSRRGIGDHTRPVLYA